MHRYVSYSERNYYLSYLNTAIHNESHMRFCGGKFGVYLEKSFGIKRLPYGIKLTDIIERNNNFCDLFVELPKECFELDEKGIKHKSSNIYNASFYDLLILPMTGSSLIDMLHPYETTLKEPFVERYRATLPNELKEHKLSDGRTVKPYELYLSYWRGYVLFETIQDCKFIERYLDEKEGVEHFISKFLNNHEIWKKKYSDTFHRVSIYKSFCNRISMSKNDIECTYGEMADFIHSHCKSDIKDLKSDMDNLLELHNEWITREKRLCVSYEPALTILKSDIYFLFEWLCYSGMTENQALSTWSYKGRQMQSRSQLEDVLDFDEVKFLKCFKKYTKIYSSNIESWLSDYNLDETYDCLNSLDSFNPWMRSFYDLHELINTKTNEVRFTQPRIIDCLLIFTIRTEIIIRDIFRKLSGDNEPDLLSELFNRFPRFINDSQSSCVFTAVSDRSNFSLTELRCRPEDIFSKINDCKVGKKWSNNQRYFFSQLLKFISSRNYFAHHSYKDGELNNHVNTLCRDVFVSCLHSVIYISSLSFKNTSQ